MYIFIFMRSETITNVRRNIAVLWFFLVGILVVLNVIYSMFDRINASDYPWRDKQDFFVSKWELLSFENDVELRSKIVRSRMIDYLAANSFSWFIARPYDSAEDKRGISLSWWFEWELVIDWFLVEDDIDKYIASFFEEFDSTTYVINKKPMKIALEDAASRSGVYFYKSQEELEERGYRVLSHRSRKNTDEEYRRHNISTALTQLKTPLILFPWDQLEFLDAIGYDPIEQSLYRDWFVVVQDEEQPEYGWWLCGASTALYQGILTNKGLWLPERRAHTKRYTTLYKASINGEQISVPWLDSTVFDGHIDLKVQNTSDHPIILVAQYDGSRWWIEEVYTLWMDEYAWDLEHLHTRPNRSTIKVDGKTVEVSGGCYVREINWEERKSCYKEVKD